MSFLKFENKINLVVLSAGLFFIANLDARLTTTERTLDNRALMGTNNIAQLGQNTSDITGLKVEVTNLKEFMKESLGRIDGNLATIAKRIDDEKNRRN